MKHSTAELLALIDQYYPRGVVPGDPRHAATEEHRRLVAARIRAGSGAEHERWRAMLGRLEAQFPEGILYDRSFYLASGEHDAAYAAKLVLPGSEDEERGLGFMVSFLAPYYFIYGVRVALLGSEKAAHEARLDLSPDEEPPAQRLAREIEATYGYEPMSPAIGNVVVPEGAPGNRAPGEGTIYDCLFSDDLFFATLR
jgi:hypothetical protein